MSDLAAIIDAYRELATSGRQPNSLGTHKVAETAAFAAALTELDPDGMCAQAYVVAAWALIRQSALAEMGSRTFTAADLLSGVEPPFIAQARRLMAMLDDPSLVSEAEEFSRKLSAAVTFYGVTDPAAAEIASDPVQAGLVGMEALVSIRNLSLHFFRTGAPSEGRTRFVDRILEFTDVPALVDALAGMDGAPSVLLSLIRDPRRQNSFFAFGIRDGGTIAVITDCPPWSHPLESEMTRNPGRRMEGRAMRNAFPYELVDKEMSLGRGIVSEGMVPHTDGFKSLVRLADLPAENGLWTFMMLDLALRRVREESAKAPRLSIFGRDLPHALLGAAAGNLPMPSVPVPEVAPLTPEETTPEALAEAYRQPVKTENLWIEERYRRNLDERSLEAVRMPDRKLVTLPSPDGKPPAPVPPHAKAVPATFFGSRQDLTKTRVYLARYNLAELLQVEADREFEATREDVLRWWKDSVTANLPRLLQAVREGGMQSLCFRRLSYNDPRREKIGSFELVYQQGEIMEIKDVQHTHTPFALGMASRTSGTMRFGGPSEQQYDGIVHLGSYAETGTRGWKCFSGKGRAEKVAVFTPDSQHCLADLAGVPVDGLPEVLRHWTQEEGYCGNSILSPVDPVNWRLRNPWRRILFRVRLNMSGATYRKVMAGAFKVLG